MSDTPRTDDEILHTGHGALVNGIEMVLASFARQLERELSEVKGMWHTVSDERDQLKSKLFRCEDDRDQWKAMAQEFSELLHGQYVKTSDIQNRFYAMRDGLK